mmetsp:Transcript_15847/g.30559  ORF Transcript_15847/g.30559 Transcript_15847/m.30559 type:complete len:325 (-) Transcript_15847:91-1065(-)
MSRHMRRGAVDSPSLHESLPDPLGFTGRASRRNHTRLGPAGVPTGELVQLSCHHGENRIRPKLSSSAGASGGVPATRKGTLGRTASAFLNLGAWDPPERESSHASRPFPKSHADSAASALGIDPPLVQGHSPQHLNSNYASGRKARKETPPVTPLMDMWDDEDGVPMPYQQVAKGYQLFTGTSYALKSQEQTPETAEQIIHRMRSRGPGGKSQNIFSKVEMGTPAWEPTKPLDRPQKIMLQTHTMKPMESWRFGNVKTWFTGKTTFPKGNNAGRMIRTAPSRFANYIQDNWTKPNEKGIDPRRLYITSGLRKTTYSKVHSYLGP